MKYVGLLSHEEVLQLFTEIDCGIRFLMKKNDDWNMWSGNICQQVNVNKTWFGVNRFLK